MMKENYYIIGYGLGGGFGGINQYEVIKVEMGNEESKKDYVSKEAYYKACEEYENYSGMYGLSSIEDIMEEEDCDEEEALVLYEEERESWLEYEAKPFSKEFEKYCEGYHYDNSYKDETDKLF